MTRKAAAVLLMSLLGANVLACGAGAAGRAQRASPVTTGARVTPRPTEPFRHEHVAIKAHLDHLDVAVGNLSMVSAAEQVDTMKSLVSFMDQHIRPHADWEERVLYPAVDKRAASGPNPFTASMRYEHRIVARWMGELAAESVKPTPDARAFARRAYNLLGLLSAHFEEEEEVLLPILDRSMSREEFQREIGSHAL